MAKDYTKMIEDYEAVDLSYLFDVDFKDNWVKCVNTGRHYPTAKDACADNGISYMRMGRHLKGEVPTLKGLTFIYGPSHDEIPATGTWTEDR